MPSKLIYKEQNVEIDINTEIIRYSSSYSESGAYIFAPGMNGRPLKLQPLDIFYL
jgi:hypothetical protein